MIIVYILIWTVFAIIAYGIIKNVDPSEVKGDEVFAMLLCFIIWPLMAIWGIGYLVMKKLSKLGEFVAGFIDQVMKKGDRK